VAKVALTSGIPHAPTQRAIRALEAALNAALARITALEAAVAALTP
jgi:hypothetical protein